MKSPAAAVSFPRAVFERYFREFDPDRRCTTPNLILLASVESTNLVARRLIEAYRQEGLEVPEVLVAALHQSAGRGRLGRTWSSPALQGIYATLVPSLPGECLPTTIPLLVGVALCGELDALLPAGCRLKWPNDLVATGGKIGGILVEGFARAGSAMGVMIGFGINCLETPQDLPAGRATSILAETGREVSLAELTGSLVAAIERELRHCADSAYAVERYRRHSIHRSGERLRCRIADRVVEGVFEGFDSRGFLRLRVGAEALLLPSAELLPPEVAAG